MKLIIRLLLSLALFVIWAGTAFDVDINLYFSPLRWPWLEGTPQAMLGIALILLSLTTYSFAASRLFGKDT